MEYESLWKEDFLGKLLLFKARAEWDLSCHQSEYKKTPNDFDKDEIARNEKLIKAIKQITVALGLK